MNEEEKENNFVMKIGKNRYIAFHPFKVFLLNEFPVTILAFVYIFRFGGDKIEEKRYSNTICGVSVHISNWYYLWWSLSIKIVLCLIICR